MSAAIAKEFEEWAARCMPPGATQIQREEMRRVFYSGFIACLIHQLNEIGTIEDADEAAGRIDEIMTEGEEYFRGLGETSPRFPRL